MIVARYAQELTLILQSLRQRHTGVYKWFQPYMRVAVNENCITAEEFGQACQVLNIYQVTASTISEIFKQMDRDNTNKIALTEVESLFKEHSRKAHPNIRPTDVASNIIRAFNGDVNYIENSLRSVMSMNANILPLEEALRVFTKYTGY